MITNNRDASISTTRTLEILVALHRPLTAKETADLTALIRNMPFTDTLRLTESESLRCAGRPATRTA